MLILFVLTLLLELFVFAQTQTVVPKFLHLYDLCAGTNFSTHVEKLIKMTSTYF